MSRMQLNIGKTTFSNPVFCASGCFGNIFEMAKYTDVLSLGAMSPKTVTLEPRQGNPPPRVWEFLGGMMCSVGLQNPGLDYYIKHIIPKMKEVVRPYQILVSVGGRSIDEYVECTQRLLDAFGSDGCGAIEINAACPNVSSGGAAFGKDPAQLEQLVAAVRRVVPGTLMVKIITDSDHCCDSAAAVENGGADALYIVNTVMGIAIDTNKRRPYHAKIKAGCGGPAFLPWGIYKTWDIYNRIHIPIIASGGVIDLDGFLQYIMAGATAVSLGRAHFFDPTVTLRLVRELDQYLLTNKIPHYSKLIGAAHKN